jgi:lipopolysaccharide transport system ATP-binding protein
MSDTVIKVENLSKQYRLGEIGTGSMAHDINRWWQRIRGKEDSYSKIDEENDRSVKSDSNYVWALQDINFEVKQGEAIGIIGRNGAGKSTLLKILSRTTSPTSGLVKIKGRIASLLEVGTGFHPELTGRDNIFLNGAILGMSKQEIRSKFDEIVDFAGVERYIDTPVKRYSSGMYVRLAFGVAAHLEPEILIVDEVLAVGDAEFQKKALGKMKDASNNEGRTVLFVSHDLMAVSKLTKKALLLKNGKIIGNDLTDKIIAKYIDSNKSSDLIYENKDVKPGPSIKKIELITNLPDNHQTSGEKMEVNIELYTPYSIKGACLSFQFVDSKDRNFTHLWLFDSDNPYCRDEGKYRLKCKIPSLKLYMGKYFVKCFFSEPPGGRLFDVVENVCPFEVVMIDVNRSEFNWYPEACAYVEDADWDISKMLSYEAI